MPLARAQSFAPAATRRATSCPNGEDAFAELSATAFAFYRSGILDDPEVFDFFEMGTPMAELEHAKIGSRPARARRQTLGLRACAPSPVGLWLDAKPIAHPCMVWRRPCALRLCRKARGTGTSARHDARVSSLFIDLIRNVEVALAKVDLGIASLYASLVPDKAARDRVFTKFSAEYQLSLQAVLAVTGQAELLENNSVLARSIRLRNPYVDPLSLIQVDLLRRKRSGEDTPEINRAIAGTINGISAGLRTTG